MGKATAASGGCWLRLAYGAASASETTSAFASTSAAPAYIHNRRGWLRRCLLCQNVWRSGGNSFAKAAAAAAAAAYIFSQAHFNHTPRVV